MSAIIMATYNFLDTLDNSKLIKNLTKYKQNILKNKKLLALIQDIKQEQNNERLIEKRKKLYQNNDYFMYIKYYNELHFLILRINKTYAKYTKTKDDKYYE